MDATYLVNRLTRAESLAFERYGFLLVEDVLPLEKIDILVDEADTLIESADIERRDFKVRTDVVGVSSQFLSLVDWYRIFPKIWEILGWNIHVYVSHLTYTPPVSPEDDELRTRLNWHQDSGRVSLDSESVPSPRISVKVGFFLTDVLSLDYGNFSLIPGSHLYDELIFPENEFLDHPDALQICALRGSAIIFDRRIYHAGGWNFSGNTRKVVFIGYSHRWFSPRDYRTLSVDGLNPVQEQLLGVGACPMSLTSPEIEDVPLRGEIGKLLGDEAVADRSNRVIT